MSSRRNTVACPPSGTAERMYRDVDFGRNLTKEMLKTYAPSGTGTLFSNMEWKWPKGKCLLSLGGSS